MYSSGTVASVLGIQTLQMGVFGGIIVGLGVAALHNRFHKIVLPNALSFFGGSRFVPIISTIVLCGRRYSSVLRMAVRTEWNLRAWRTCNRNRLCRYFDFWYYQACADSVWTAPCILPSVLADRSGRNDGSAGQLVQGGQNIFFAQLADPSTVHFSADATRYFSGEFIFMIFGLPGAALAMYHCAKKERRKNRPAVFCFPQH